MIKTEEEAFRCNKEYRQMCRLLADHTFITYLDDKTIIMGYVTMKTVKCLFELFVFQYS